MSERIERWVNVHSDGSLGTFWDSPPPTLPHARVAHFVEIRDGESIAVNGETDGPPLVSGVDPASGKDGAVVVTMAPWSLVDDARKERDEWERRALSAESQVNDAAAKFERWAAVRFFGKPWQCSATNEVHYFGRAEAMDEARQFRSHYFPPAKEVSNG